MNKRLFPSVLTIVLFTLTALASDTVREHVLCETVSLNGAWSMAYSPHDCESVAYPAFEGVTIARAIPGFWEDLVQDFRSAGMKEAFRIHPLFERQTFPLTGWADDTTLPNIRGCFYYRRDVSLERPRTAVLAFEGVRNHVRVWVNGRFAAQHSGFSTPFELTIPEGFLRSGTNEFVLAVSNGPVLGYGDYACGLTTRSIFRGTGGVDGNVELRFPADGLGDVYVTTAADLGSFTIHAGGVATFEYAVSDGADVKSRGTGKKGLAVVSTAGYLFWSPENPKRYTLTIRTSGGTYRQRFGIRRLAADGEKLCLNGKPVYLRGVTEHCYYPLTVHVPRDLEYFRMVTRKRKELGFNFVRFHTHVPPAEYLEATDELGMLVHIESPNFVSEPEYADIVSFARRHPSVVIYCTGNETRIDRLAEAYLRDVAEIVHRDSDALFSPMSALRGVEYYLSKERDVIVAQPFPHNPERLRRLLPFCDLFTSYQQGALSYDSLNACDFRTLDLWGGVYGGKPWLAHEICIDSSYVDFSLEKRYPKDSPILKAGIFSGLREQLAAHGLLDRADVYFRNSCEWMRRIRKFCFEKVRACDRIAGYDFLGDINTHWHTFGYSVGMMDEFYRLKPGETVENVRRYNSAAVLLADLGSDFNVTAGTTRSVAISLSNYDRDVPSGAMLDAALRDASSGCIVWSRKVPCGALPCGRVSALCTLSPAFPDRREACKYLLNVRLDGVAENEWELYAFPKTAEGPAPSGVRVVTDLTREELMSAMARGERVLLLGAGPFKTHPMTFRIGLAGRCAGDYATVVRSDHPVLKGFPNEGYCGWQFRRLMEGGRSVQLEAGVPFDPIVDLASAVKCPIRQSPLFEYRVGSGRLLVCSFAFVKTDPAADWLRNALLAYAASDAFEPRLALTLSELQAVIDAPLVSGAKDDNRARNPSDPSSDVRADEKAQP